MGVPSTSNFFGEDLVCEAYSLQFFFGEGISMSALPSQIFLVTVKYVGPFHLLFSGEYYGLQALEPHIFEVTWF